ncbi:envelope glycoprotein E [Canid alphaherpesvirus 1]|nr:envelope glycoprotein E [Canid alphaherpesvirus 1]QQL08441.1 envelope glycoprotein E [Canid alphaherpesvirus 1]WHU31640.1 envelope glycoprotein E [Canid alphaherpesvirus 1]WHU31714.1 envelope glycoprotein E [Canid alphaherpesvirus 1]
MFRLFFLIASTLCSVRFGFSTIHNVIVSEKSGFVIDGYSTNPPFNETKKFTRGWVFLQTPPSYCKDGISISNICIERNICEEDIFLNKRCTIKTINYPLAVADFEISNNTIKKINDVYFVNDSVFPIITTNKSGIHITNVTINNSGIYTLYENNDKWSHQSKILVTIKKKETVITKPKVYIKKHGGFFHVKNYHSHVFVPNDSFKIELNLESEIYDSEFSASIDWYYMKTSSECSVFHIYETCIFHPHANSCLNPINPLCSFTSPLRATSLINRFYFRCKPEGKNWTTDCINTFSINADKHIKQHSNNVDLIFSNTPTNASGLYVFILKYNGHPEAWTYTLVSTVKNFMNVIKDMTRPLLSNNKMKKPEHSTQPPTITNITPGFKSKNWVDKYIISVAVVSCITIVILIVVITFCVHQCIGLNRKPYEIINPFNTAYKSLPTNEKNILHFAEVTESDYSSDESFDSDSEELNQRGETIQQGKKEQSGYTIWFNEDLEESVSKKLNQPNYSKIINSLKSIQNE